MLIYQNNKQYKIGTSDKIQIQNEVHPKITTKLGQNRDKQTNNQTHKTAKPITTNNIKQRRQTATRLEHRTHSFVL